MALLGPPGDQHGLSGHTTHGQRHNRISPPAPGDGNVPEDGGFSRPSAEVETSATQKMLSAVTGSILTSLIVTPLDVVRVRQQTQSSPSPSAPSTHFVRLPPNTGTSACCREVFWVQNQSQFCVASSAAIDEALISECAAEETQKKTFNSTLDGLRKIARNEGPTTLWRGLSPTLAMAIPANVIYFAGYDWLRTSDKSPIKSRVSDAYAPLMAGSLARVLAAIVVSPIEMLRTRMQASHPSNTTGVLKETIVGIREMVARDGYRSLWRGLNLTLWRDVPFSAFYWWGYEYGRDGLHEMRERGRIEDLVGRNSGATPRARSRSEQNHKTVLIDSFIAGAGSGAIAAFVTTPFDVAKTRQQTARPSKPTFLNTSSGTKPAVRPENRPIPQFLWHIFRTEGTVGLFKGWAARCLKVAPACAIMISSYELSKKMASNMNDTTEL